MYKSGKKRIKMDRDGYKCKTLYDGEELTWPKFVCPQALFLGEETKFLCKRLEINVRVFSLFSRSSYFQYFHLISMES